jgi:hypothetical protein
MTALREKLGAKAVRHGRYVTLQTTDLVQTAGIGIPITLFAEILRPIDELQSAPVRPCRPSSSSIQVARQDRCARRRAGRALSGYQDHRGGSIASSAG